MTSTPTPIDFLIDSIIAHNNNIRNPNPNAKFPCGICKFDVKHNSKAILCTSCDKWVHIKCHGISNEDYKTRQKLNLENPNLVDDELWECLKCITDYRAIIFPFGYLNNFEIENLNSLDSIHLINAIPEFEICADTQKVNNLNSNDIDENIVHSINSRYYTCQELFNLDDNSNDFNL